MDILTTPEPLVCDIYQRNSDRRQQTSQINQTETAEWALANLIPRLFPGKLGIVGEKYVDDGISASKGQTRPALQRWIANVQSGKAARVLLIRDTKRLSREDPYRTIADIYLHCKKHRIAIVDIVAQRIIRHDTLGDQIVAVVDAAANHEDARSISRTTLDGRIKKLQRGKATSANTIPYGFYHLVIDERGQETVVRRGESYRAGRFATRILIPGDDIEVEVVQYLFREYATKRYSLKALSRHMNDHPRDDYRKGPCGITRGGKRGSGWDDGTLAKLLTNPHYIGVEFIGREPSGTHYRTTPAGPMTPELATAPQPVTRPMDHPRQRPLIDKATWDTVQTIITNRKSANAKPHGQRAGVQRKGYALTRILICGTCDRPLYGIDPDRTGANRYRCCTGHRTGRTGCETWSVKEADILPYLVRKIDDAVLSMMADRARVQSGETDDTRDAERVRIEREVTALDAKMTTVSNRMKTATIDATLALADTLSQLADDRATLSARLAALDADMTPTVNEDWTRFRQDIITATLDPESTDDGIGIYSDPESYHRRLPDHNELAALTLDPADVRTTLEGMGVRVYLWFREGGKHGQGKRWEVSKGRITLPTRPAPHPAVMDVWQRSGLDGGSEGGSDGGADGPEGGPDGPEGGPDGPEGGPDGPANNLPTPTGELCRSAAEGAAMMDCPVHGFAGTCIYSPALLELRADGTVPEVVTIELKDTAAEEAFFRINVTPEEAAALPVVDGRIPFDLNSCEVMDRLPEMCGFCLHERRQALLRHARHAEPGAAADGGAR